jgi:broad specificity phosphatase PhoE
VATRFILIRHGQTEWNRTERFRGHADIPLNETGRIQAHKIAARLAAEPIDALYSSPLQRAVQTAEPLAETHHLPIQQQEGLIDINFGALEGLTVDEARQAFPEVIEKWLAAPGRVKFPKGDSLRAVRARIEKLLAELAAQHPNQTVALVSHKVTCGAMLCYVIGLDADALWNIAQDNGCINRFETRDQGFVITLLNDTSHLRA